MPNEWFAFGSQQSGLRVVEIDTLHRLRDVHLPRSPPFLRPVPVVNPISRIAVFLDLDQNAAGAESVHPAAWQKHGVAGFDLERLEMPLDFSLPDGFQKRIAGRSLFHAGVKPCFRRGARDVPKLRLRFAPQFFCNRARRMNLKRKIFLRVDQFAEDGKPWGVGNVSEDFGAMFAPEFV